jgi:spermidine synthase
MLVDDIKIEIVKSVDIPQMVNLYKDAGWWVEANDGVDPNFIQKIVEGSFCFVIATLNGNIIGMGRSVSDGVSDAYIQDVAVLKEYRNNGIGKLIMDKLIDYLYTKNISWIGLIAEPNAVSFYHRYGFKQMEGYVPFLLPDNFKTNNNK